MISSQLGLISGAGYDFSMIFDGFFVAPHTFTKSTLQLVWNALSNVVGFKNKHIGVTYDPVIFIYRYCDCLWYEATQESLSIDTE